eukprot:gene33222-44478_t
MNWICGLVQFINVLSGVHYMTQITIFAINEANHVKKTFRARTKCKVIHRDVTGSRKISNIGDVEIILETNKLPAPTQYQGFFRPCWILLSRDALLLKLHGWNGSLGCFLKCYWRVNFSFMMIIIAVVMSCIKVYTQIQDQRKFYRVFKQILKEKTDHMKADYLLFLFDCFVNVILSILTVFLTFSLISRSDKVTDLVLNCLTITFIVEFEPPGPECTSKQSCNSDGADKPQLVEKFLTSADYSSDPTSINKNSEVLKTVKNYIQNSKLLPVLNSCFRHDPHPGKPKFLVLQFNVQGKAITINVREKLVADFTVMEQILSRNLVKDGTAIPTPNKRRQQNNQSWCCFVIQSFFVVVSILTVMWLFFGSIVNDFLPKYDWQRESGGSGSDIRLTWIHDYEPMSKSNLEAQVTSAFLPTTDNHTTTTSTAIENVLVTISGEKNSMKLMTEFGFLPAI